MARSVSLRAVMAIIVSLLMFVAIMAVRPLLGVWYFLVSDSV